VVAVLAIGLVVEVLVIPSRAKNSYRDIQDPQLRARERAR